MLNHEVEHFQFIARTSLARDMKKRGVPPTNDTTNNFLGYQLKENGFLNIKRKCGSSSDWMELSHYVRTLGVEIKFQESKAVIIHNNVIIGESKTLQKRLFKITTTKRIEKAKSLVLQGNFIQLPGIIAKASHSIYYNSKINDDLVKFCLKARLNILPTNFTKFIWNRENNPACSFCKHATETVAHVLNGCKRFRNFYSSRHDRIVNKIYEFLKLQKTSNSEIYKEKMGETLFPEYREEMKRIPERKPDIVVIDKINKRCTIIEITIPYDLYFAYAKAGKIEKYERYCNLLRDFGYVVKVIVLCFGSLGTIDCDVWSGLVHFMPEIRHLKELLHWCSISVVIGSNYIWRARVKQLLR